MDYFWAPPAYAYDPAKAKQLLAEAGYPNGFDGGDFFGEMIYGSSIGEPVTNYLRAVGIRSRLRLMERAAYY
jgi:peptide/nickel transport system substrate-binding protein